MSNAFQFTGPRPHVLVVDDERMIRWSLREALEQAGAQVEEAASLEEARRRLAESWPDLMLLDLRLPDGNGMELLEELLEQDETLPVLMITAYGSVEGAVRAMQAGAQDYIAKPFELDDLLLKVASVLDRRKLERLAQIQERGENERSPVEVSSAAWREVAELLERVGRSGASTVLLTGESGVGKGYAARMLHEAGGNTKDRPFVAVSCTAIPETLLESELFGHEQGAFTDARRAKPGLAELAHGGTLFLDEIGDLPPAMQAKMLTLLEDRSFRRVGGTRDLRLQARVVAATHRDLEAAVEQGQFRSDLYYRLRVVPIEIPPLRQRREDVLPLAEMFLERFRSELGTEVAGFSAEASSVLQGFHWPGNIRELRNAIERAALLACGDRIEPGDLPAELTSSPQGQAAPSAGLPEFPAGGVDLAALERHWVAAALAAAKGNRSQAARLLGMNRDQIRYRLEKYDLGN